MDPSQYAYTGYAQHLPPSQPYPTMQHPEHRLSQSFSNGYNASDYCASYIQPHYYGAMPPTPHAAELPAAFVAELPASLPATPPTTTSERQLTEDELLAHKLQNMEVEEARRRSSSTVSHRPSHYSLRDAATFSSQTSQHQLEPAPRIPARPHSGSFSSIPVVSNQPSHYSLRDAASLSPQNQLEPAPPRLPPRPHSGSFSSRPVYAPDSFGPPPAHLEISDGRRLMTHAGRGEASDLPPQTPLGQNLPEVVVGARPVSTTGLEYARPVSTAGLECAPTIHTSSSTLSLPPAPTDPVSLAVYLEEHRSVPYPPQWLLPPIIETLYAITTRAPKASSWLDLPLTRTYSPVRPSQQALTPTPPSYTFTFKSRSSGLLDEKHTWRMSHWTYTLKLDSMSGLRKMEVLTPLTGAEMITTYIPAPNYDSLRFIGGDGRVYLWVAHAPLRSTGGARWDVLRHALFVAPKGRDPLYGEIVADHAYWDGYTDYYAVHIGVTCKGCGAKPINGLRWRCTTCTNPEHGHDICEQCRVGNTSVTPTCSFTLANLPDETLHIRSKHVDPALVVATLQIMRDWEMHVLRRQMKQDPNGFRLSEEMARKGALGKVSYWRAGDDDDGQHTSTTPTPVKADEVTEERIAEVEKAMAKEEKKAAKAREKEKCKGKDKEKKGSFLGVGELIRGSAQVGGSVGDVGEALRRDSRSSAGS